MKSKKGEKTIFEHFGFSKETAKRNIEIGDNIIKDLLKKGKTNTSNIISALEEGTKSMTKLESLIVCHVVTRILIKNAEMAAMGQALHSMFTRNNKPQ